MYQEAAYFIQQQMAELPTKSSLGKEKEEEKKKTFLYSLICQFQQRICINYVSQNYVWWKTIRHSRRLEFFQIKEIQKLD